MLTIKRIAVFKMRMARLATLRVALAHRTAHLCLIMLTIILTIVAGPVRADDDYLDPEVAFKFSATMVDAKTVAVTYTIANDYYMYRESFRFAADGATLGTAQYPAGKIKFDDTFQKEVETYRNRVTIRMPVEASGPFTLKATSQGCADKGLCYAPMESEVRLSPAGGGLLAAAQSAAADSRATSTEQSASRASMDITPGIVSTAAPDGSEMGRIEASLKSGRMLVIVPLFILLGLGLAFTPCVLPMVPILSFIIVGEGAQVRRRRALLLSVTYAFGMAIVYTALGIAAGLIGEGLSATLQHPWMLGAFGVLMIVLAMAMFDVYQLQVPAAIQQKLMKASEQQPAGKLAGVFTMGAISALIVGPCVAAPLAGALVYISQTRDVVIGGSALFAMAVGMSVPLLLVGVSAGTLLPRAGVWMDAVKRFFGVLMLAMALWLVSPILPAVLQMIGWAALGIGYGAYLLLNQRWKWGAKVAGLVFATFGAVQLIGVATGGRDAWAPLAHVTGGAPKHIAFSRVKSIGDLDAVLAQSTGKIVMLDFYADWCVSCKEMEKFTFADGRVAAQMDDMVLLQADVTANDADDKAMLKRFKLFGPPGIIFFDRQGREIPRGRVIGYQGADKFLRSLAIVHGAS